MEENGIVDIEMVAERMPRMKGIRTMTGLAKKAPAPVIELFLANPLLRAKGKGSSNHTLPKEVIG